MCTDAGVPLAAGSNSGSSDCDYQHMEATDTRRGGGRHELAVEYSVVAGFDVEGERVRTGETSRFPEMRGCTHVSPVAGGADSRRTRTGVSSDD